MNDNLNPLFYGMLAAGAAFFFAGRFLVKKYSSPSPTFAPALFLSLAGLLAYLGVIFSWVLAPILVLTALLVKFG